MSEPLSLTQIILIIPFVMFTAGLYASVGLGGGTGYIAILSLVGMSPASMVPTVLLLNIVVSAISFLRCSISIHLQWRLLLSFLLPAIPTAFLGGCINADKKIFYAILAVVLTLTTLAMFLRVPVSKEQDSHTKNYRLLLIGLPSGLLIGFLSGFLGIGGGVFLGPILLFSGFANIKQVAAINSVFIILLSFVGLIAHGISVESKLIITAPLAVAALIGGLAGATLAEKQLSPLKLQRVFAVIILIAAFKAAFDAIS